MLDREMSGRQASPSIAIVDSQSVKTTEAGGPRGFDAGKKVKGRKRHVLVDADGRPLVMQVHSADIQDRDGARPLLARLAPRVSLRQTDLRGLRLRGRASRKHPHPRCRGDR
jgi:hypothetical protein